ncbi:MAG: hypothetical protein IJD40_06780 [Lachnospiraceae bacterium]|nr:hypothetical protein [Lachnospiraceae bacterium]
MAIDQYTQAQLDNAGELLTTMVSNIGMEGLKGIAELCTEVCRNEKLVKLYNGVSAGNDILEIGKAVVELVNIATEYEGANYVKQAQLRSEACGVMFGVFGVVLSFSELTAKYSFVFSCASTCLDYGLNLIELRIEQLEYYDALAWGTLDEDEVEGEITSAEEACDQLRDCMDIAKKAIKAMEALGQDTSALESKIGKAQNCLDRADELVSSIDSSISDTSGSSTTSGASSFLNPEEIADDEAEEINNGTNEAESAKVDPLIIDIAGDGFNIEKKKDGTYFDLDCNGFAEKINWTMQDGILVLDKNNNGNIDDGSELFGDYHLLSDGSRAKNGFEALAQYDTNGDGVIDGNDEIYNELKLWIDADGDGKSTSEEINSLEEMNIKSINLNYKYVNAMTDTEAVIGNVASFEYGDGTQGEIGEMWVSSDLYDTIEKVIVGVAEDVDGLPNVRSYGTISSLHNAIMKDQSGVLKDLVEVFSLENNNEKRLLISEQILHYLCGTGLIEENSRGQHINAKNLAVIESFLGEGFMGTNGGNPNSAAAVILNDVYNNLVELYCFAMIGSTVKSIWIV